jgi:hypothetical protein
VQTASSRRVEIYSMKYQSGKPQGTKSQDAGGTRHGSSSSVFFCVSVHATFRSTHRLHGR